MDLQPNIKLIRFKEYYGMPRGHEHDPLYSLSIRNMVFQTYTVYFWGKRRSSLHPNTAQRSFFPLKSYSKKTLRKNVPKGAHKD